MAELTDEKRMEMEAEMSRFELEILAPDDAPRMIIGANTFNKVQAALKATHIPEDDEEEEAEPHSAPVMMAPPSKEAPPKLLPPPPPPPPILTQTPRNPHPVLRPPPPPPRPAFVPPQLRHRPPAPPPRFPPGPPMNMQPGPFHGNGPPPPMYMQGGQHRGMGPGPGPRMGFRPPQFVPAMGPNYYNGFNAPGMGPPPDMLSRGVTQASEAVISKPKVVYSAAPVLNKPKVEEGEITAEKTKASTEKKPTVEKPVEVKDAEHPVTSQTASSTVPQPSQVPMLPDYSLQDLMDMPMDAELVPGHHAMKKEKKEKKKKIVRTAAGQCWEDQTLSEWEPDDFRIFCGDLGNEVTDDTLGKAFNRYGSFVRAKVVRDKRSNKTKGYGFVSFRDPNDFVRAMREMNGKYVGNRPIKLRKSTWRERNIEVVRRKDKEKKLLGFR